MEKRNIAREFTLMAVAGVLTTINQWYVKMLVGWLYARVVCFAGGFVFFIYFVASAVSLPTVQCVIKHMAPVGAVGVEDGWLECVCMC